MKSRTASVMLALGLFVLAIWMASRPDSALVIPSADVPPSNKRAAAVLPSPTPVALQPEVPPDIPGVASTPPIDPGALAAAPSLSTAMVPSVSPAESVAVAAGNNGPRDARTDEGKVRLMLRDYRTLTGGNPVGTNTEIMQAIMGGNPKQATLGPPEGMNLNGDGELVDQWETPYFFHQISREVTEIRSAGPDKHLWTADDIVTR